MRGLLIRERYGAGIGDLAFSLALHQDLDTAIGNGQFLSLAGNLVGEVFDHAGEVGDPFFEGGNIGHDPEITSFALSTSGISGIARCPASPCRVKAGATKT